jgi:hypothetical protein
VHDQGRVVAVGRDHIKIVARYLGLEHRPQPFAL